MAKFLPRDVPAKIHLNKYLVQDDEYNYYESLQASLMKRIGHWTLLKIGFDWIRPVNTTEFTVHAIIN